MQLSPRQVSYGLNGLKQWLAGRDIVLNTTPGVGIILNYTPEQIDNLAEELAAKSHNLFNRQPQPKSASNINLPNFFAYTRGNRISQVSYLFLDRPLP